jgi:hypothetical protein
MATDDITTHLPEPGESTFTVEADDAGLLFQIITRVQGEPTCIGFALTRGEGETLLAAIGSALLELKGAPQA